MSKRRPLLQVALDTLSTEEAIRSLEPIHPYIDIIEVGTILLAAEGVSAIKRIRDLYPDKIIVADGKVADAGNVFSKLFFGSGANLLTCICAAETATIAECVKLASTYEHNCEVQVELTSHFTFEQAKEWAEVGVTQVVYHRARDAQAAGRS